MKIILLPGMDGTGLLYESFCAAMGAEFSVVPMRYPVSAPLGYRELEALVSSQLPGTGPYLILAESFSGPIGIAIAATAPPGLCGLILCCSFAKNPMPLFSGFLPLLGHLPVHAMPHWIRTQLMMGGHATADLKTLLNQAIAQVSGPTLNARMKAVLACNVTHKLASVRVPMLYMRASEDRLVGIHAMKAIQQACPAMNIAVLEGPHFLLQAAPAQSAGVVRKFAAMLHHK
jgi:pimeloyl-ACP methyl ester carboxylesterase